MSQNPFVVIKTCNDLTEAQLIKALLEQNDIAALVQDENFNSVYPVFMAANGVNVKVHEDQVREAHSVLTNITPLTQEHHEPIPAGTIDCPACGSSEVFHYRNFIKWSFDIGSPSVDGTYKRCANCDHRWRGGDYKENMFWVVLMLSACAFVTVWLLIYIIDFIRYL